MNNVQTISLNNQTVEISKFQISEFQKSQFKDFIISEFQYSKLQIFKLHGPASILEYQQI